MRIVAESTVELLCYEALGVVLLGDSSPAE